MDLRDIIEAAEDQGFHVDRTSKGHWRFVPPDPDQPIVHHSGTPSDWRAVRNLVARLRRVGLEWPPKGKGR